MLACEIYSPRKGVFEPSHPIDGLELITAVQLCLGREMENCYRLLQWARMRARGESVQAFCIEVGQKRSTFYYRRARGLDRVAGFLNEQRAAFSLRLPAAHPQMRSPSRTADKKIAREKRAYRW